MIEKYVLDHPIVTKVEGNGFGSRVTGRDENFFYAVSGFGFGIGLSINLYQLSPIQY